MMFSKIKRFLHLRNILFVLFAVLFAVSLYHILGYKIQADQANHLNQNIIEEASTHRETYENTVVTMTLDGEEVKVEIMKTPDISVDISKLRSSYPSAVGWLYGPQELFHHPIVQTSDNNYYLNRLPDGRYNISGSLFLDCRNPSDISGWKSVIYGHHMQNGSMFAPLLNYRNQDFFEKFPYLFYFTEKNAYRLEIFAACNVTVESGVFIEYNDSGNLSDRMDLIRELASDSMIDSEVTVSQEDRIIILSTCSSSTVQDDNRFIVAGKLVLLD